MDTLYLFLFPSFTESSWKVASPLVSCFDILSQIEFNVLGTPQLIMPTIDGLPKTVPIPNHNAAVVTPHPVRV